MRCSLLRRTMSTAAALSTLALISPGSVTAQSLPSAPAPQTCRLGALLICAKHVAQDEGAIATSPIHTRPHDLLWIMPFGVATGVAVHFDTQAIHDLGIHPTREDRFNKLSDYGGLYAPFAASAAGYAIGTVRHDGFMTETAMLSAEAMADAGILDETLKYALDREYPMADNAQGVLWPHGPKGWPNNPSMPSEHAMNIWAFAHVVAGQYDGIATKVVVYSLASTVSVSRVLARQHFPSDVVVGSTVGWFVGGYVLHRRSHEHGFPDELSEIQTPLGRGVQLQWNLSPGQ
jgi:hypothetical protein